MMLRGLIAWVLRLLITFALVGGLIAREWGWSEYASDELYVVYRQGDFPGWVYLIINTDGDSQGEKLRWRDGAIEWIDCSPDGRTLAFLTDTAQLNVFTSSGIVYQKFITANYMDSTQSAYISVANNGQVALGQQDAGAILIDAEQIQVLRQPEIFQWEFAVNVSSEGVQLWDWPPSHFEVFSPTGDLLMSSFSAREGRWLASEEFFYFNHIDFPGTELEHGTYLGDVKTQDTVLVSRWIIQALAPDSTILAESAPYGDSHEAQVILRTFPSGRFIRQLTRDPIPSWDVCFLTFRPEMLVDNGS